MWTLPFAITDTYVYTGIDASMHIVSHDHTEFSSAGINNPAFQHYLYVLPVVAEVCNFRTGSKITAASYYTVSHITQVPYVSAFHNNCIF